ncbi:hypothetical protein CDAR_551251 [Caerostris darwini]|uniref:Uncharacterized protein n=1 Tax=Caerostris darwini TaxID=1538125 RepID=A0AAV4V6K5_9ARAC|nr:hypothetical protein CDAR_551251 [Caerostris darwini]
MRREQRAVEGEGASAVWEGVPSTAPELKTVCLRKITSLQFCLASAHAVNKCTGNIPKYRFLTIMRREQRAVECGGVSAVWEGSSLYGPLD